ncbi:MAG: helix-turn-helix domain-containing protein [Schleiferilactobacillus harbinensis]
MTVQDDILQNYHHLLMLDDDDDKEKHWIWARQPAARGLTTLHFHILSFLLAHPNCFAKDISQQLGVLRGTLSKQLTQLKQRRLLDCVVDTEDARYKHYVLTPTGETVARTHNDLLQLKNHFFSQKLTIFDIGELRTIHRFLELFIEAEEADQFSNERKENQYHE